VALNSVDTYIPLIKLLLQDEYKADLARRDRVGRTALELACNNSDYFAVKALIDCYDRRGIQLDYDSLLNRRTHQRRDTVRALKQRRDTAK
jgi:hypothetical protein